ncbi:MAG TPA: hypothetical protein VH370_17440 [Humisphaera sp.]|nr:hypothetical protein [Humisphaera sp.]
MIFFTDENFPHKANALLRAFDQVNEIRAFLDHFRAATPDIEWLRDVGKWQPKPHIVCGDGRILRNKVERAALRDSGCNFIHLAAGWTNTPWTPYCQKLIKYWPDVIALAAQTNRQAVIELTINGKLLRKPLPG